MKTPTSCDRRPGAAQPWYELAHDRLIEPILADNANWRDEHLTPFQRAAAVWDSYKQDDNFLLSGDALVEAERWSEDESAELTPLEQKFITESRDALPSCRARPACPAAVADSLSSGWPSRSASRSSSAYGAGSRLSARAANAIEPTKKHFIGAAIASTAGIADPNPRILLPAASAKSFSTLMS